MKNNILVIGGTGKTGRKVVEKLKALDYPVRVGSRSASPSFDWNDQTTWANALEGIEKMYITYQPDLAVPGALDAIEAMIKLAKRSGVKKAVLLSGKGEREAELSEQVAIHSGMDYTIVRASWFMQNFSESFFLDPIIAGHVALPKAEAKVPYVNTDDIADVVVEALTNEKHNGQLYELTGPRVLTFEEITTEIATAAGREIQFTPISMDAYINMLKQANVSDDYIWLINYLFTEVLDAEGNNVITGDIEKVLGRKPKDFSEYAEETAKSGVWNNVNSGVL
ncbi:NAD(P)H-binding protein [Fulvivirga lutimaris]|uniref:NmrA family NAD(P)-binding protein n=1 Tax=Fulvivirga lutimaris TaxID=1819566 RepID=UPI0012BCB856|nr:NmrA family NAD(P)-binding protein [Fulvivirga lutimaris]MTI41667.1 NmrA family transcriptional regulator [Fulvivirga lutimaris]